MAGQTVVSIEGDRFFINGEVTYPGTAIEGRLMNSRMVQATFDDLNPETRSRWDRPGRPWDAQRNTDEFIAQLPTYHAHGLLAFTTNFQGGSPEGYSKEQPWHNSGFDADGTLRPDFAARMGQIIDAADELGMVVILGLFYFGQDERLNDEAAIIRACDQTTDWLIERGDRNVIIEVGNEVDLDRVYAPTHYQHPIIQVQRGDELIQRIHERSEGKLDTPEGRLLVSTSQCGGQVLAEEIAGVVDFVLLHGNGVESPSKIIEQVEASRQVPGYRGQPIVYNEDDHFDFDQEENNLAAAVEAGASWGYFDYRMKDEGDEEGYQSVPTDWSLSSERKRGFFEALKKLAQSTAG
ncbi:hypothetical protein [Algisphaera agarilytica]|uniref:Uncharacterized protein n=1 Tax=Algisphaera agarilytica TaxID=1385975 RepID=A0A7X0LJK8_9BACT|nr:hypothetical protein [Algisphaera agarilytica]MBB6428716.1 hypothetical protein [Algisphaera agarilytica]